MQFSEIIIIAIWAILGMHITQALLLVCCGIIAYALHGKD